MEKNKELEEAFKKHFGHPHVGYDKLDVLYFGAKWQAKQSKPHRITESQLVDVMDLWQLNKISHNRMVEILNEIAAGKHKEGIEI